MSFRPDERYEKQDIKEQAEQTPQFDALDLMKEGARQAKGVGDVSLLCKDPEGLTAKLTAQLENAAKNPDAIPDMMKDNLKLITAVKDHMAGITQKLEDHRKLLEA